MTTSIQDLAKEWLNLDQDTNTRTEIQSLLDVNNTEELEKRLRTRIAFGTAGLRAKMEAGFSRMNSLTVIQTSQGLAEYILNNVQDAKVRGIVIGFDARNNSKKFAKLAGAVFINKGIKIRYYENPVHTPLVSFGVEEFNAVAGIMITASHNPPQDNGYKVYWEHGVQIIPPVDKGIAKSILENLDPLFWDDETVENSLLGEPSLDHVLSEYVQVVKKEVDPNGTLKESLTKDITFAYTALHGVGLRYFTNIMTSIGIDEHVVIVQEQAHPDPNFPGLPFPNPEEKGVLDVAIWSADRHDVPFIIANDPDADRLAIAEKVDNDWYLFTGNQIGCLLASYIYETYHGDKSKLAMIASTVSSSMLSVIAHQEKFHFVETLTGFKWMGNEALKLNANGFDTRFAFEEAIGYMIPGVCFDKDGVAAATTFIAALGFWKKQNFTPYSKLQNLYQKYGYFEENNTYFISPDPSVTLKVFEYIRSLGEPYVEKLGQHKITYWRDLTEGWDSSTKDHKPLLPVDKDSQMITFSTDSNVRITIRGSGTEPKIKLYMECHSKDQKLARSNVKEILDLIVTEWLRLEYNGLKRPGE